MKTFYLQQVIQETAGQYILDFNFSWRTKTTPQTSSVKQMLLTVNSVKLHHYKHTLQPEILNLMKHTCLLWICLFIYCVAWKVNLTCSEGVEEEKELANSSADVERVEGLLQSVQLRQSGDQLQDVVLQILHTTFFEYNYYGKPLFSFRL